MAVTPTARTFIAGETETASFLNNLRDVLNFVQSPPLCIVTFSVAQSVPNAGLGLAVGWNAEITDVTNMHNSTTNTSRFTPTYSGWYEVTTHINFTGNATGYRQVKVSQNGTTGWSEQDIPATGAGQVVSVTSIPIFCNGSSDYMEVDAWQNSGGALNIQTAVSAASVTLVSN